MPTITRRPAANGKPAPAAATPDGLPPPLRIEPTTFLPPLPSPEESRAAAARLFFPDGNVPGWWDKSPAEMTDEEWQERCDVVLGTSPDFPECDASFLPEHKSDFDDLAERD